MARKLYSYIIIVMMMLAVSSLHAQHRPGFNPEKFERDLEQFVIQQAKLNQKETAAFLPVFRDMRKQQVKAMREERKAMEANALDERACAQAIRNHDSREIQQKKLLQAYHNQLLKVLPATKVLQVIRAEDDFHRQAFRNMHNRKR